MQHTDPNLHAQTTANTHLPGGIQGNVVQGNVVQPGLVQPGLVQGGLHQGGLVQGGLNQGLVQPGLVQGGLVQDPNLVHQHGHHTHHTHTTHTHHHGGLVGDQQTLINQTGVHTTSGMTLVSTQVGQTVQVGQPTITGGQQVYTTVPGVVTTTHTHHTGLAPAVGTGLVAGAGTGAVLNHNLGNDYRGTFVFRPLEGRFTKDKDIVGKMDPYVKIKIGWHSGKSSVAKSEGVNPVWGDVIPLEKKHHEEFAKLKIKDKDRASLNDKIGETKIPLADIAARGRVNQWFPVYKKEIQTGEILLDIAFEPLNRVV